MRTHAPVKNIAEKRHRGRDPWHSQPRPRSSLGGVPIAMEALRSSLCRCALGCRVPPKCVNQASARGELRRFQANLCCRGIGEHALQNCDRINRCFDILDSCMSVATGACAAQSAQGFFASLCGV